MQGAEARVCEHGDEEILRFPFCLHRRWDVEETLERLTRLRNLLNSSAGTLQAGDRATHTDLARAMKRVDPTLKVRVPSARTLRRPAARGELVRMCVC